MDAKFTSQRRKSPEPLNDFIGYPRVPNKKALNSNEPRAFLLYVILWRN